MATATWGSTDLGGTIGTLHAGADLRVAWWPGAPNGPGTIILVHGRAEFIETYGETIAWLAGRGYAVITFDFRGQGGSARRTRESGHIFTFREYVDDLRAVVKYAGQLGLPRPFHVIAHSMGGLVALLAAPSLAREVERMVLLAPLLGIERLPFPPGLIRSVTGAASLIGFSRIVATKLPARGQPFDGNRITSDAQRYARLVALVDGNPQLLTGPPTFGWVAAALNAMRRVRRMMGRTLPVPTLFVASGKDSIVSTPAIDRFARSVTGGGLVLIPGAEHQVLIERDGLRRPALAALDAFLLNAPRRLKHDKPVRAGRPLRFTRGNAEPPAFAAGEAAEARPVEAPPVEAPPVEPVETEGVEAKLTAAAELPPATAEVEELAARPSEAVMEMVSPLPAAAAPTPEPGDAAAPAEPQEPAPAEVPEPEGRRELRRVRRAEILREKVRRRQARGLERPEDGASAGDGAVPDGGSVDDGSVDSGSAEGRDRPAGAGEPSGPSEGEGPSSRWEPGAAAGKMNGFHVVPPREPGISVEAERPTDGRGSEAERGKNAGTEVAGTEVAGDDLAGEERRGERTMFDRIRLGPRSTQRPVRGRPGSRRR